MAGACLATVKAAACAACFGQSNSPMAKGLNAGIFALLGVVVFFWILFGTFFVFIARRARQTTPVLPGEERADRQEF
jgi:heme/copper-type cytochrome/quinol oxidase subunit 2